MTVALLACGVVGAALFVLVFVVDGATRPGYRPSYHPVSALSLGERGWVQTTNFVVTGVLMVGAAIGMRLALGSGRGALLVPALIGTFGVALVASGVFPMDPMRGYPPGTPPTTPTTTTRAHVWHDHAGVVVFASLPAACIVATWRFVEASDPAWAIYSAATAAGSIATLIGFGTGWERDSPRNGATQRLMIVVGWTWVAAVCLRLMSAP